MSTWKPTDAGVQQICHLLAEIQKPGTNQAQVKILSCGSQASSSEPAGSEAISNQSNIHKLPFALPYDVDDKPVQVLSQLEQCTKIPDFNNYLAYIFADGENLSIEV